MKIRNFFSPLQAGIAACALLAVAAYSNAQSAPSIATNPVIMMAAVNSVTGQLVIQGINLLPTTGAPVVHVDGAAVIVVSFNSTQIVATFPPALVALGGTQLVTLKAAGGTASCDLAVGSVGPQGLQGPAGPPGTLTLPYSGSQATSLATISVVNTSSGGPGIASQGGGSGAGLVAAGGNNGGWGVAGYGGAGDGALAFSAGYGGAFFGGGGQLPVLSGTGVYAKGGGTPGDGIPAGDGIDAAPGSDGGVGIFAVFGHSYSPNGINTVAGVFVGDVQVSGNLSKAGGSFQIDHPLDPANKYLYHSFVESPEMMNVYNGIVTTDGSGNAMVTMPDWFESLNRDFRYELTTIGQPAQAWVAFEINHNTFAIMTDKPSVKVSWQVTGIRQDAWANAHRIPLEVEKDKADQGHYLHPELFDHADEPSIPQMHHHRPQEPARIDGAQQ